MFIREKTYKKDLRKMYFTGAEDVEKILVQILVPELEELRKNTWDKDRVDRLIKGLKSRVTEDDRN